MDEGARHSLSVCLNYLRTLSTHAAQYRQTSNYGPRAEGYEFVEVPLWMMRQMIHNIEGVLGAQAGVTEEQKNDAV